MTTAVTSTALAPRRRGPRHWLRSFAVMLEWNLVRMRLFLPMLVTVQIFLGAGLVLGISLLYDEILPTQVLYLGTGAVVITVVTMGIVIGPQMVSEQRLQGSYDWFSSLPIPRSASAAAWTAFNVIVAVPGAVAALLAVWLRFDADLHVNPLVIPAVLLVLGAGVLVGYAYAHLLPNPRTIQLVSQVMIFIVIGFAPVAYPAENLPDWFASLHEWLPFLHMGEVTRAGLTTGLVDGTAISFLVLGAWTAAAAVISTWAIRRRP